MQPKKAQSGCLQDRERRKILADKDFKCNVPFVALRGLIPVSRVSIVLSFPHLPCRRPDGLGPLYTIQLRGNGTELSVSRDDYKVDRASVLRVS